MGITERGIVGGAIGIASTAIAEGSTRLDAALNPQIFETLRTHMEWYQLLTTNHAVTVLYLDHEPLSAVIAFGITALVGTIAAGITKHK